MQISTRGRYAVMAMVDLASRDAARDRGSLVCLADIAGRQQLSLSYLEQLFSKLRRAGLVLSARGPGGGFRAAAAARSLRSSHCGGRAPSPDPLQSGLLWE